MDEFTHLIQPEHQRVMDVVGRPVGEGREVSARKGRLDGVNSPGLSSPTDPPRTDKYPVRGGKKKGSILVAETGRQIVFDDASLRGR